MKTALLFYIGIALCPLFALEPFFAPAQPSGSIEIKLFPMENVQSGNPTIVTFGIPFTRGSLDPTDLTNLRILKNNQEIPAFVEILTPWRHLEDPGIDIRSVRVARVQISYTFSVSYPDFESISAEWGNTARTQNRATFENPRNSWHLVTTGTFTAEDSVYEPDVYAVLPKQLLSEGILKPTRMDAFHDTVSEARDDPQEMDNIAHWSGHLEQEFASKNFFYSIIDEVDPAVTAANRCQYKAEYEPWLFDRSSTMFILYFRSGFLKALREAVRSTQFYRNHINASGFFDLKSSNDAKYSYNECFAYCYWLTGDEAMAPMFEHILQAHSSTRTRWAPGHNFWTERHSGFKLLAYVVAYEILGKDYKDSVLQMASDLMWHQNGADNQIPANRVDGGLYHYGRQHDGDWASAELGGSPWMSAFIYDPMLRVYAMGESPEVADFICRLGNFLKEACRVNNDGFTFPRYAMLYDGSDGQVNEFSDVQHAIETASGIAWAHYFANSLNRPDPTLKSKADSLYLTYDDQVNYWTRPAAPASGLTAYRVSPWRKYSWEYRTSHGLSWALRQAGTAINRSGRIIQRAVLIENSPNPFSSGTVIRYRLNRPAAVQIKILTPAGRLMQVLANSEQTPGLHSIQWDGRDRQGKKLPAGIYICRLISGRSIHVQKIILMH
jgi:hypothetical protein